MYFRFSLLSCELQLDNNKPATEIQNLYRKRQDAGTSFKVSVRV